MKGGKLMKVKDVMSTNIVCIEPNESAAVAARLLSRFNIGALPVCTKDGRLRGMVTDRDIVLRCVAADDDAQTVKVSEIMTRRIYSVDAQDSVQNASALMARQQIRRLPVEEGGKLVGMVSLGDVAKLHDYSMEAADALSEISMNTKKL